MFFWYIYMFIPTVPYSSKHLLRLYLGWFWGPNTFTEGIWSTWGIIKESRCINHIFVYIGVIDIMRGVCKMFRV